jgi:hypothetical protein
MKKTALATLFALAMTSTTALAGGHTYSLVGTGNGGTKTNTNAYAGLNWTLGGSWTPAVVVGVFRTRVKSDGDTEGANLALHINLTGGIKPGKLKLSYLNGQNDIQGAVGFGYDFARGAPLLTVGANGPFIGAGIDGLLNIGVEPYLNIHTQDRFKKPSDSTQRCVEDSGLVPGHYINSNCTTPWAPAPT